MLDKSLKACNEKAPFMKRCVYQSGSYDSPDDVAVLKRVCNKLEAETMPESEFKMQVMSPIQALECKAVARQAAGYRCFFCGACGLMSFLSWHAAWCLLQPPLLLCDPSIRVPWCCARHPPVGDEQVLSQFLGMIVIMIVVCSCS